MDDPVLVLRAAGVLAMLGALLYAVGDSLLLAVEAPAGEHPRLEPHATRLGDMARLAALDPRRIAPGGLAGVLATPLVMAGWWLLWEALRPAGDALALPPVLLFAAASVVGAFVHGWFMALADDVRLLAAVDGEAGDAVAEVVDRHKRILGIAYAPVIVAVLVASAWTSVLVWAGDTALPTWMVVANPIVLLGLFLAVRRVLPGRLAAPLRGAGFNVAYLVFFALLTTMTWNGVS